MKNKQKVVQKNAFRVFNSIRNGMWSLQTIKKSWAAGFAFANESVSREIQFVKDNVFWIKPKLKAKFVYKG